MNQSRLLGLTIGIGALAFSTSARAEFDTDYFDWGGGGGGYGFDSIDVGYDSWGAYGYDSVTSETLTDMATPTAPMAASGWDYASTVPEGGYTIINGVMWPTCYGCTINMTGAQATSLGVYDAYRQYNTWDLLFTGHGLTDSQYIGTYQGDTSFLVSNNFSFTHDFVVEQEGQWMTNLTTPYCADLCVATFTNGQLTNAINGNAITNYFGKVYDSVVNPYTPPHTGDGDGDGDGDGGDGDGGE